MKAIIQYNENFSLQEINPNYALSREKQVNLNSLFFTGKGGSSNMDIKEKTVPPIFNKIGAEEIQSFNQNLINLIRGLNVIKTKSDFEKLYSDTGIIRAPFRVLVLQSKLNKPIFAPKISIFEHPVAYILSVPANQQFIDVIYDTNNYFSPDVDFIVDEKENISFSKYTSVGDTLFFPTTEETKTIINIIKLVQNINGTNYEVGIRCYLDSPFAQSLSGGTKVINVSKIKYNISESSITYFDINTEKYYSPFKFLQLNLDPNSLTNAAPFDLTTVAEDFGTYRKSSEYQVPVDLIYDYKSAGIIINQENQDSEFDDYALNSNLNLSDNVINLITTAGLKPGDYLTIAYYDGTNQYEEYVYVESILDNSHIAIKRGEFNSNKIFATPSAIVKKAKPFYFQLSFFPHENTIYKDFYYENIIMRLTQL